MIRADADWYCRKLTLEMVTAWAPMEVELTTFCAGAGAEYDEPEELLGEERV